MEPSETSGLLMLLSFPGDGDHDESAFEEAAAKCRSISGVLGYAVTMAKIHRRNSLVSRAMLEILL
jgi:hypothetical protein